MRPVRPLFLPAAHARGLPATSASHLPAPALGSPPAHPPVSLHPPHPGPPHPALSCSAAEPPTELFAPAFSLALAPDPLLAAAAAGAGAGRAPLEREVLLAVGLDSGLTDFKRPRLNLVLLLDVSGSMGGEAGCCWCVCLCDGRGMGVYVVCAEGEEERACVLQDGGGGGSTWCRWV